MLRLARDGELATTTGRYKWRKKRAGIQLTDDKSGNGSNSDGSGGTPPADLKNKSAKISMDQAFAEIERLSKENKDQATLIEDLSHQLEEANKVLESQDKAKLVGEILPRSSFKMEDLVSKSIDDLKNIRATLDQAMPPKVNSVRFGVQGADLSDRERGLTVGDLSWETAQKRKRAA